MMSIHKKREKSETDKENELGRNSKRGIFTGSQTRDTTIHRDILEDEPASTASAIARSLETRANLRVTH